MSKLVKSFEGLLQQAFPGSGITGDRVLEDLAKAMATTSPISGLTFGDMTPLRLENLDAMMTSVLFTEAHLKLFNAIPRVPSIQPLYQWNRRDRYGSNRGAVGFREGGAPTGGTSKWTRNTIMTKYLGVRGGYTHQALVTGQQGGSFVDPVQEENRNRTLELLEKIERHLFWGQKAIKDGDGNEVHYDGIFYQIQSGSAASVIDKEGQPLDFNDLENASVQLRTTGKLTSLNALKTWAHPQVLADLAKLKIQAERRDLADTAPGYRPGVPLEAYRSQFGPIVFDDSIFLDEVEDGRPLATADAGALGAPATVSGVAGADATSKLPAGTYYYFASTLNDAGESVPTASSGVVVATSNASKVTLTIARVTNATAYRVYRSEQNSAATARWIGTVAQPTAGDAELVDLNSIRPGTMMMFMLNLQEQDIAMAQMAPLIKFPLAIVNTTIEFLLLLYHVTVVKAPERMIVFKNIGARA